MVQPTVGYLSVSGVRYRGSESRHELLVAAYTTVTDGGVSSVSFNIVDVLGNTTTVTQVGRSIFKPTDTEVTDPVDGSWGGGPSPIWCYGMNMKLSDYAAGPLYITAFATPATGVAANLGTQIVHNDYDGVDRRPSTRDVFVSPTGDDSNHGTRESPKQTLDAALESVKNPSTNSVSGATVYMMAGSYVWGSTNGKRATVLTDDDQWVTIAADPYAVAGSVIVSSGSLTVNAAPRLAVRLVSVVVAGGSLTIEAAGATQVDTWMDGCEVYAAEALNTNTSIVAHDYAVATPYLTSRASGRRIATGCKVHHTYAGFVGYSLVRGCTVADVQNKAVMLCQIVANCTVDRHSVKSRGYIPSTTGTVEVSKPSPGITRYTASSATTGWPLAASALATSTTVKLFVTAPGSDNSGVFQVAGGGSSGGKDYIDVVSPLGTVTSGTTTLYTCSSTGMLWDNYNQAYVYDMPSTIMNTILCNFKASNVSNTVRGVYVTGAVSKAAFENVCVSVYPDGGVSGVSGFVNSTVINLYVRACSFPGSPWVLTKQSCTNVNIVDCIFDSVTASGVPIEELSFFATHNHFVNSDVMFGQSATSGEAWVPSTSVVDASVVSKSEAYGTYSGLSDVPSIWRAVDRGAWSSTAKGSFSTPVGALEHDIQLVDPLTFDNTTYYSLHSGINPNGNGKESIPTFADMKQAGNGYAWKVGSSVATWDESIDFVLGSASLNTVKQSRKGGHISSWSTNTLATNIEVPWLRRGNYARGINPFEKYEFNKYDSALITVFEPTMGGSETHPSVVTKVSSEHVVDSPIISGIGSVVMLNGSSIPMERVSYGSTRAYAHGGNPTVPAIAYRMKQTYTLSVNSGGEGVHELNVWSYNPSALSSDSGNALTMGVKINFVDLFDSAWLYDPATDTEFDVTPITLSGLRVDLSFKKTGGQLEAYSPIRYSLTLAQFFSTGSACLILRSSASNNFAVGIAAKLETLADNLTKFTTLGLNQRRILNSPLTVDADSGPTIFVAAEDTARRAGWIGSRCWILTDSYTAVKTKARELHLTSLGLDSSLPSPNCRHPLQLLSR